ncbi:MAG: FAD-dependent oxidoreductase [Chloroflexota bacterium]
MHPTLNLADAPPAAADLVVIGGGIVGAATAFYAQRAGLRTVLLEARPSLATLTTPVSTGAFRLQFDNPDEIRLVRKGIDLFTSFAQQTGLDDYDIGLQVQGYLFCTTSEAGARRQREWVESQHTWGLSDVEILSGDEARYRFPHISPAIVQARFRAGDGWLKPRRVALGLAAASEATICLSSPVVGIQVSANRVTAVETSRGTIACSAVVNAAGPFSGKITELTGQRYDIRPRRRMKLVMPDVPEVPRHAPMTIDEETVAHWRPGLNGAYGLFTDPSTPVAEPTFNVTPDAAFAFDLLTPSSPRPLARISPFWAELAARGEPDWVLQAGQYEYTPDHRPYLGPTAVEGFFLNCGYSGHGIMASPGGSQLVVDQILGRDLPEGNPFRPDRPLVERPLDIL